MKNKILLIIILILVIGILFIPWNKKEEEKIPEEILPSISIELNPVVFGIYEKHYVKELIKESNVEILSNDELLDTQTLGKQSQQIKIKIDQKEYSYPIEYEIKDLTPPVFIKASSNLTILNTDQEELCQKIVYADNYDSHPTCKVSGTYELGKIGTYSNLEFVITDESGNEKKWPFTLNIIENYSSSTPQGEKQYLPIEDVIKKYKTSQTSIGIDVSRWQGNVDFNKVKEAGIEFVIMRIGTQISKEDSLDMDSKFLTYYQAVRDAGLKVGVYVYNTATTKEGGKKTAEWVIEQLHGDPLDLPVAYDFEDWSNFMEYEVSLHSLSSAYKEFEKTLNEHGYEAMLYSSKFYLENVWLDYEDSNIWLAHYTDQTNYQGKYMLWQMSSLGRVDGITENTVDIDILYH